MWVRLSAPTELTGSDLLETFLLPSLVGAMNWISRYATEESQDDLTAVLLMANKLIRPQSISGDAQAMHSTILSIGASRLSRCLGNLKGREPTRSDLDPLLNTLKPYLHYSSPPYATL